VKDELVGRFRIERPLGKGGMGEVLAAFDDELERPVAVKLLHADISDVHRDRLLREAKALAQLSHPNVVQVYEVGAWNDRLFIAMELVGGRTLDTWIAEETPALARLLDVFIAAGSGLAAAHDRDLIHRDFKPTNVIIGEDGRPRILDFGLARKTGEGTPPGGEEPEEIGDDFAMLETAAPSGSGKLGESLTQTGTILGTPAYMSPEQLRGQVTDASADQFSFCVALWEAAYGRRPFGGKTVRELTLKVTRGNFTEVDTRGPARLRRALVRGLSVEADARWPNMRALLDELSAIRSAPIRQRRAAVSIALVSATAGVIGWAATRPAPTEAEVVADAKCTSAEARFAGVWDDAVRQELDARYGAAAPRAQQWWTAEQRVLDQWQEDWIRIYDRSCEGNEREDSPMLFAQRQTCLDRRWNILRVRVETARSLEPAARATAASGDYLPFYLPSECENEKLVSATYAYPTDPVERREVLDAYLDVRIAAYRVAASYYGDPNISFEEEFAGAMTAKARLAATNFPPALAELALREGHGLLVVGQNLEFGFQRLQEASQLAQDSRVELLYVLAELWYAQEKIRRADGQSMDADPVESFERWEAALVRVGSPAAGMIELLENRARLLRNSGDPDAALADIERQIAIATESYGPDSPFTIRALTNVAKLYADLGFEDRVGPQYEQVIASIGQTYGPDSLQLLSPMTDLAGQRLRDFELDAALSHANEALALSVKHYGQRGTAVLGAKLVQGQILLARGDLESVKAILDEAWAAEELDVVFLAIAQELQAAYSAIVGVADAEALERLKRKPAAWRTTASLIALVTPLLDDSISSEQALSAVDLEISLLELPMFRALGQLVRGKLLAREGRFAEAAAAHLDAECGCAETWAAAIALANRVEAARALREASDPGYEQAAAAAREHLTTALPAHPWLDAL